MKRLICLIVLTCAAWGLADSASAEPAWGASCLACHNVMLEDAIFVIGEDGTVDPVESGGAPDRGVLQFFTAPAGATANLACAVVGLDPGDTYAVELKRFRYPGVEAGGVLAYSADCDWPEWGVGDRYYTEPHQTYYWGADPTLFNYGLRVAAEADHDYYNLVFAVAGRLGDTGELFYAEQHFYIKVEPLLGDIDGDGDVDLADLAALLGSYGACVGDPAYVPNADLDSSGCIDLSDLAALLGNYGVGSL